MLYTANMAPTAMRFAPKQTRRCMAGTQLRGTFSAMQSWLDASSENYSVGQTGSYAMDNAWQRQSNTLQVSAPSRPAMAVDSNIKCWQLAFNNFFSSSNIIPVIGTDASYSQAATVLTLHKLSNATAGVLTSRAAPYTSSVEGWEVYGWTTNGGAALRGNVGTSLREWSSSQTGWSTITGVLNKAAASGSEVTVYQNGTLVTSFSSSTNSDNTNAYGTQRQFYGVRFNGAPSPLYANGYLSQAVIFGRVLTATEVTRVLQLMRWRAGFTT